jgi:hypothetical protein
LKKKSEALEEFKEVLKLNGENKIALKYKQLISNDDIDLNKKEKKKRFNKRKSV